MSWEIREGDALARLREMPDASVHCVVTSPPYWGLRDYGVAGQLGLERTPEAYTAALVGVFAEVRRVLRDDGTLWLNLGDSYAGSWGARGRGDGTNAARPDLEAKHGTGAPARHGFPALGIKPKDLVGIPWRVFFALQADGWWLRSDIVWHKPNPMPESVTDRPTRAHEYVGLFSKAERYFYDAAAIAEPAVSDSVYKFVDGTDKQRGHGRRHAGFNGRYAERLAEEGPPETRNRRTVWTISPAAFPEAHFATFPPELPELCIKAGCPVGGTVLDPFAGAGTTGLVATRLGRSFIGVELNPTYAEMARRRIDADCPLFNRTGGAA